MLVFDGPNGPFTNAGSTTSFAWPCGAGGNDVWYLYIASCSGAVTVDTCGASYDSTLQIFNGSGGCGALVSLGCNDDSCGLQSSLTVPVTSGLPYYIRVGGFGSATGSFPLTISCAPSTLANEECTGAVAVVDGPNGPFTNVGSTTSSPWPCGAGGNDVWFLYVASCTGAVTAETCGASYDTTVEIFNGTAGCAGLVSLGCNDDAPTGPCQFTLQSTLTVPVTAGLPYYIRVGGFASNTGTFPLTLTCQLIGEECDFPETVVDGANGPYTNVGYSTSSPWPCGSGGNDRWFVYTPSCLGTVTVNTCGSSTDTTLEVFDGTFGCSGLVSLGCNDDTCGLQSSVTVPASCPGALLYIRVGGFAGATGPFGLNVVCTPSTVPNDECCNVLAVVDGVNGPFSSVGSTTSSPWPCGAGGNDVWFVYTASCCGNLTATTCTSSYDTTIEVFTGDCSSLVSLGCNDDASTGPCSGSLQSLLTVPVATGFNYYIRVGGFGGATGTITLNLTCTPTAPANDNCSGAIPVGLGLNGPFTNICSTTSSPWPCGAGGNDVWFLFVASCTAPHTLLTCGADYDTTVEVFDGTAGCGGLVSLGCNDDSGALGPCSFTLQSRLQVTLTLGTVYYIRVGGFASGTGNFPLEILPSTGLGTITLSTPSTCPFPGSFTVTGDPNLGGTVTAAIAGATGLPFISYGFVPQTLIPGCPCQILSVSTSWQFTTSLSLFIPCVAAFIGTPLEVQGAELFPATPPSCPIPVPNHFTDIYTIVVG